MEPSEQQVEILLVEDSRAERTLLQYAFLEHLHFPYRLHMVDDGEAALAFLHQRPPLYTAAPQPTLIFLDIHLPKYNGWDVLAAIRTMPALTNLRVVMLTGEMGLLDVEQREQLKPNLCFLKPFDLEGYRQLAKSVTELISQNNSAEFSQKEEFGSSS